MKRTLLLLTVLAVTVGFTSMAYATDNVMCRMLIPGYNQTGTITADSTLAKMFAYNNGQNSINIMEEVRRYKAKMIRLNFFLTDTCASCDSVEIVTKISYDDTLGFIYCDSQEVIPKTISATVLPHASKFITVQSDTLGTYLRTYVKQWCLTATAARVGYVAEIHFYDADGVWVGKKGWKTMVSSKGGY